LQSNFLIFIFNRYLKDLYIVKHFLFFLFSIFIRRNFFVLNVYFIYSFAFSFLSIVRVLIIYVISIFYYIKIHFKAFTFEGLIDRSLFRFYSFVYIFELLYFYIKYIYHKLKCIKLKTKEIIYTIIYTIRQEVINWVEKKLKKYKFFE
jgi:hypothetical protein